MFSFTSPLPDRNGEGFTVAHQALSHYLTEFNQHRHCHFELNQSTQEAIDSLFTQLTLTEHIILVREQERWQQMHQQQATIIHETYLDAGPAYTLAHTFDIVQRIPAELLTEASFENFFIGALLVAMYNIQVIDGVELSRKELANLFAKSSSELAAWQKSVLISIKHRIPVQPTQLGTVQNEQQPIVFPSATDESHRSSPIELQPMVHKIVYLNNVDCLKPFINRDTLNAKDGFGQTPLIVAAAFGFTEIVRYLLQQSPELHWSSQCPGELEEGATALDWAYAKNHQDIITLLKAVGAPYHHSLDLAWQLGHIDTIYTLIPQDFKLCQVHTEINRHNIFHWIRKHAWNEVQLLAYTNPSLVNQCDVLGYSPLLTATIHGSDKTVEILLAHGADTSLMIQRPQSRYYQNTALDIALMHESYTIATLLRRAKAPVHHCRHIDTLK